jgi:hypothetical protein
VISPRALDGSATGSYGCDWDMRRLTIVLTAVALFSWCFVPASAAPTTMVCTAMAGTFDHCTKGLGVASGRIRFSSPLIPGSNCKSFFKGEDFSVSPIDGRRASYVIAWNTGNLSKPGLVNGQGFRSSRGSTPVSHGITEFGSGGGGPFPQWLLRGNFPISLPTDVCTTEGLSKLTYKGGSISFGYIGSIY